MNSWLVGVAAVVTAIGGAAGIFLLLTIRQQRRKLAVTADDIVAGTVKILLGSATGEIAELKKTLGEVRNELYGVKRDAAVLERELQRLLWLIHTPSMTIEQLRERVPMDRLRTEGGNEHRG